MKRNVKRTISLVLTLAVCFALFTVSAFATADAEGFQKVVKPIVDLLNTLVKPLLAIVGAVGTLYCILLGVKYAKAEEAQDREKAKAHLKNAIIGFVLIFVLILVLNLLMPAMINWVNSNAPITKKLRTLISSRCILLLFWQKLTGKCRERPKASLVFHLII